ncbi:MAG: VanZ family protein [Ruminiclostridium sp.]
MKANLRDMSKPIKLIFTVLLAVYVLLLVYLTFFSQYYGRGIAQRSINIIPFRTITEFLTSEYNRNSIITNIAGNIVAFMPMGFLLPIVYNRLHTSFRVCLTVLFASILIEVSQYFIGVGASDIDDIILNVLGGTIGYWIYRLFLKVWRVD